MATRADIQSALVATGGDPAAAARLLDEVLAGPKYIPTLRQTAARTVHSTQPGKTITKELAKRDVWPITYLYSLDLNSFAETLISSETLGMLSMERDASNRMVQGYMRVHGYDKFPAVFPDVDRATLVTFLDAAYFVTLPNDILGDFLVMETVGLTDPPGTEISQRIRLMGVIGWERPFEDLIPASLRGTGLLFSLRVTFVPEGETRRRNQWPEDTAATGAGVDFVLTKDWLERNLFEILQAAADREGAAQVQSFVLQPRTTEAFTVTGKHDKLLTFQGNDVLHSLRAGRFIVGAGYGEDREYLSLLLTLATQPRGAVMTVDPVRAPLFVSNQKNSMVSFFKRELLADLAEKDDPLFEIRRVATRLDVEFDDEATVENILDTVVPIGVDGLYDAMAHVRTFADGAFLGTWPNDARYDFVRALQRSSAEHRYDPAQLLL